MKINKKWLVGGAVVVPTVLLLAIIAWVSPSTDAEAGACLGDGTREPITWTVTNREDAFPEAPGYVENVVVSPDFSTSSFTPQPLENTGNAQATARTDVPPEFSGTVSLDYDMVWRNNSDNRVRDTRAGSAEVEVRECPQPTTTTERPTTTTTEPPTTTTTEPPTTTTEPPTTTTTAPPSTTVPPSTTTTEPPTTTTPETTTTVPETTTSTTVPETTTTTEPPTTTTEPPTTTVPPTTVPEAPPAPPVTVPPQFTG